MKMYCVVREVLEESCIANDAAICANREGVRYLLRAVAGVCPGAQILKPTLLLVTSVNFSFSVHEVVYTASNEQQSLVHSSNPEGTTFAISSSEGAESCCVDLYSIACSLYSSALE